MGAARNHMDSKGAAGTHMKARWGRPASICNLYGAVGNHMQSKGAAGTHMKSRGAGGKHLTAIRVAGNHMESTGAAGKHMDTREGSQGAYELQMGRPASIRNPEGGQQALSLIHI